MANVQHTPYQPVAGVNPLATVTISDVYANWLIENGYGTPPGGNAGGYSGIDNTSVAAAVDPTLAEVRGVPGSEAKYVASAQVRTDVAGATDTRTVVKTP